MSETTWAFLATAFTVAVAFVGTIYTTRSSATSNTSDSLDARTQKLIENLTVDNAAVRVEVASLRDEVLSLRPLAARLFGVDLGELSPMGDLHELGWNHVGNDLYANPLGIHVVPYHDDIDEHFALGWQAVPLENVPASKRAPRSLIEMRRARMTAFAAEVRRAHGLEPVERQPEKG